MIRFVLLLSLLSFNAAPAVAQSVSVRSGEHAEFSRIVLRVPRGTEWSLETQNTRAELSVGISNVTFDTRRVFTRIPRERITQISQENPGAPLVFKIGCDCEVSAEIQGGTLLVLDVRDQKGEVKAPVEFSRLSGFELGQPNSRTRSPNYKFTPNRPEPVKGKADLSAQMLISPEHVKLVNTMEQRLLDQIKRASDQGLVKTDEPKKQTIQDAHAKPDIQHEAHTPGDASKDQSMPKNIAITTSIDRDLERISDTLRETRTEPKCLSDQKIALNQWGDGGTFGAQISFWRSRLVGEFDQPDPDAIVGLARTYLHFGFGAEAVQTLSLLSHEHPEAKVLEAIAETLDQPDATIQSEFSGQHTCDGDVAMWAVLSNPEMATAVNEAAVLRAFSRLPAHLRQHIGPRLSRAFSDVGKVDTAQALLRPIERIGDDPNAALAMAQAATATSSGKHAQATAQRTNVAQGSTEQAPLALVELIDHADQTKTAVPPDMVDLIASYAVEFKRSQLGPELRRANAIALAIAGDFTRSFEQLDSIVPLDGETAQDKARHSVFAILTERADDITFLKYSFSDLNSVDRKLPEAVGNPLGKRLLDLGFPKAAIQVLTGTNLPASSVERRLLRARAAIAENLPHQALVSLLGVDGKKAAELRGQAFLQIKNYEGAAKSLDGIERSDLATRSRWLAGTQEIVDVDADGRYVSIVGLSQSLDDRIAVIEKNKPLAQAHSLITTSQETRQNIADLLQTVTAAEP